jgi:hypothetical protein
MSLSGQILLSEAYSLHRNGSIITPKWTTSDEEIEEKKGDPLLTMY